MLAGFIAVGTDVGVPAEVRIFTDTNDDGTHETMTASFHPFGAFSGGVRIAFGDFDGDDSDEIVVAAGPGGGPHVIIFDLSADGVPGAMLDSFYAYTPAFAGGVFVAAGDLDGDGRDELVTGADSGGGPHVRVFSDVNADGPVSDQETDSFYAYTPGFRGGVRVAVGNADFFFDPSAPNTGKELITGAGPGGGPHVKVWQDLDLDRAVSDHPLSRELFAYSASYSGGVYVASGYSRPDPDPLFDPPSFDPIIVGPSGGGQPVRIFTLRNPANGPPTVGFYELRPYGDQFRGGIRVAAGASHARFIPMGLTFEYYDDVIVGPGPGGGPHVRIFSDSEFDFGTGLSENEVGDEFFAFDSNYRAGIFVAYGEVADPPASGSFGIDLLSVLEELDPAVPVQLD